MNKRLQVVRIAESWLRTPFRHQGEIKGAGVGCGTLLAQVYGEAGFPVPTLQEMGLFTKDWHLHTKEDRYFNLLKRYAKVVDHPGVGDIVLFKLFAVYAHSAIVVNWPTDIIHVMWRRSVEHADATKPPLPKACVFLSPFEDHEPYLPEPEAQ